MDAQWDPNLLLYGEALRSALDGNAIGLAPPHLHMHPGDASAAVAVCLRTLHGLLSLVYI